MTVLSAIEQDLQNRLAAKEAAFQTKASELEAHLEEAAKAHRRWLIACAVCFVVGVIVARLI